METSFVIKPPRGSTHNDKGPLSIPPPASTLQPFPPIIHLSRCRNGFGGLGNSEIKISCSVCHQKLMKPKVSWIQKTCRDRAPEINPREWDPWGVQICRGAALWLCCLFCQLHTGIYCGLPPQTHFAPAGLKILYFLEGWECVLLFLIVSSLKKGIWWVLFTTCGWAYARILIPCVIPIIFWFKKKKCIPKRAPPTWR